MVIQCFDDFKRGHGTPLAAGKAEEGAGFEAGDEFGQKIEGLPVHRLAEQTAEVATEVFPAAPRGVGVKGAYLAGAGEVPEQPPVQGSEDGGLLGG